MKVVHPIGELDRNLKEQLPEYYGREIEFLGDCELDDLHRRSVSIATRISAACEHEKRRRTVEELDCEECVASCPMLAELSSLHPYRGSDLADKQDDQRRAAELKGLTKAHYLVESELGRRVSVIAPGTVVITNVYGQEFTDDVHGSLVNAMGEVVGTVSYKIGLFEMSSDPLHRSVTD